MTTEQQQALVELPLWVVAMLAIASGFSGEMWRADKAGLHGWALVRRVVLRSGASVVFGGATAMLLWSLGLNFFAAMAIGFVVATMGADVATVLYERWLAKKAGVCDLPPRGADDGAAE